MMKKAFFFTVILLSAVSSFAQDSAFSNRYLFIEGTANRWDHREFFMRNFVMEAVGAGYVVTDNRSEASHTIRFNVLTNTTETGEQQVQPDSNQYVVKISLLRNTDDIEVVAFDFFFTELEEVYPYNRELFQNATLFIPPLTEEDLNLARVLNNRWKNKWLYVRASFDYPITFYLLQGNGLIGGVSLYSGSFEDPKNLDPLNHSIIAMPGATVGVEVQFLDFMSFEINYQLSMGDTRDNTFINMAAGAELKFPIKFENIVLAPYAASTFSFATSPVFSEFPQLAFGGGIQLSVKGGSLGAFFVDIKYMFSLSDAVMHNPYLAYPAGQQLSPEPAVIHYKRSAIGIGIGYKIGFFDRIKRERREKPAVNIPVVDIPTEDIPVPEDIPAEAENPDNPDE